jgi:hypothetical protein
MDLTAECYNLTLPDPIVNSLIITLVPLGKLVKDRITGDVNVMSADHRPDTP